MIANTPQTLEIYDVTRPETPVQVSSTALSTSGISGAVTIFVRGRYAYLSGSKNGLSQLFVFDISNSLIPIFVGSGVIPYGSIVTSVQGKYAYLSSPSDALVVVDISNPSTPIYVGSYIFPGNTDDVNAATVFGRYAYAIRPFAGKLDIFDISNPASISLTSEIILNALQAYVTISGHYAYTIGPNLVILDIANPTSPSIVSSISLPQPTTEIAIRGHYAYLTTTSGTEILIFDITNPAAPIAMPSITGVSVSPRGIAIQGRYLYTASRNGNALSIYDLGGIDTPALDAGSISADDISSGGEIRAFGSISTQNTLSGNSLYVSDDAGLGGNLSVVGKVEMGGNLSVVGNVGIGTNSPTHALDVYGDCIAYLGTCINTIAPSNLVEYVGATFHFAEDAVFSTQSTSRYLAAGGGTISSTDIIRLSVTRPGNISNLYIKATGNTFSGTVTFTVMKNGVDTALTTTFSGTGIVAATNTSTTVAVSAGDVLALKMTTSAGSGTIAAPISASFEEMVTTSVFSSQWTTNVGSISYNDNVGIGTTSPSARLSIAGSSGGSIPVFSISTSTASFATSTAFIIDSNGKIGIGTTTPFRTLSVVGTMAVNGLTANSGSNYAVCINNVTKEITADVGGACNTSSARFKDEIGALTVSGLDMVGALKPSTFKYKNASTTNYGLITEDVAVVDTHLATYEEDGTTPHGLDTNALISLLVKSVQELNAKIEAFIANGIATIKNLVVDSIKSKTIESEKICLGQTCVTEDQLKALLLKDNISPAVYIPSATPTPSPTPTPAPSLTPTPTATATATPTPIPETSASPTPTPTPEASVTPSPEASATPTASVTPSPTPSPTIEPTPSPTPTQTSEL